MKGILLSLVMLLSVGSGASYGEWSSVSATHSIEYEPLELRRSGTMATTWVLIEVPARSQSVAVLYALDCTLENRYRVLSVVGFEGPHGRGSVTEWSPSERAEWKVFKPGEGPWHAACGINP
jgi:hypothetical protein